MKERKEGDTRVKGEREKNIKKKTSASRLKIVNKKKT